MPWQKDYDQPGVTPSEATAILAAAKARTHLVRNGAMWALYFEVLWHKGRK